MNFARLRQLVAKTQIPLAEDSKTSQDRAEIDRFLHSVLPEEEREFIDSYFISDEATIFDCSLANAEILIESCERTYGVKLNSQDLKMPLYVLVTYVIALSK